MKIINDAIYKLENELYLAAIDMDSEKIIKISNALTCLYELKKKKQKLINKGEK